MVVTPGSDRVNRLRVRASDHRPCENQATRLGVSVM